MNDPVSQCVRLIREAKTIAALTGAGISTKAGIPDFRGPQGLYVTRRYDPDKVFDIDFFHKDPSPFYQFARDFILLETKIKPTFAHQFLSDLEKAGKCKGVITQNIDSLHQMAGSKNVYEMHGSFWVSRCLKCGKEFSFAQMKQKLASEEIPHCACGGVIKPDVVFFGENVKYLAESEHLASRADLFFVIGTSCVVYPAAMIPQYAQDKIVVVNHAPVELPLNNVVLTVREDIDAFFTKVAEEFSIKGGRS
jgi:NAD-dependent deacetylase